MVSLEIRDDHRVRFGSFQRQVESSATILVLGLEGSRVTVQQHADNVDRSLRSARHMEGKPSAMILMLNRFGAFVEEQLEGVAATLVGKSVVDGAAKEGIGVGTGVGVEANQETDRFGVVGIHAGNVEHLTIVGRLAKVDGAFVRLQEGTNDATRSAFGNGMVKREGLGLEKAVIQDGAVLEFANFGGMRLDAAEHLVPLFLRNELVQDCRRKHGEWDGNKR